MRIVYFENRSWLGSKWGDLLEVCGQRRNIVVGDCFRFCRGQTPSLLIAWRYRQSIQVFDGNRVAI